MGEKIEGIIFCSPILPRKKSIQDCIRDEYKKLGTFVAKLGPHYSTADESHLCLIVKQMRHCSTLFTGLSVVSDINSTSCMKSTTPLLPTPEKLSPNQKLLIQPKLYATRKPYGTKRKAHGNKKLKEMTAVKKLRTDLASRKEVLKLNSDLYKNGERQTDIEIMVSDDSTFQNIEEQTVREVNILQDILCEKVESKSAAEVKVSREISSEKPESQAETTAGSGLKETFTYPIPRGEDNSWWCQYYKNRSSQGISLPDIKSLDPYISRWEEEKLKEYDENFTRGWLSSSVIDCFAEIITSLYNVSHQVCPVQCWQVVVAQETKDFAKLQYRFQMNSTKPMLQNDVLLFPFQETPSRNHWALIILDIVKEEAIVLDSMCVTRPQNNMQHEDFICKWTALDPRWSGKSASITYPHHVKQNDVMSCGVFLCYYIERYLQDKSFNITFDVDAYRKKIYNIITEDGTIFTHSATTSQVQQAPSPWQQLPSLAVHPELMLLKNGNQLNTTIKFEGKELIVKETSTFDAIFHLVLAAYCDSRIYSEYVRKNILDVPLFEMIYSLQERRITKVTEQDIYIRRARILADRFKFHLHDDDNVLDTTKSRAQDVLTTLMRFTPSIVESTSQCWMCSPIRDDDIDWKIDFESDNLNSRDSNKRHMSIVRLRLPEEASDLTSLQDLCNNISVISAMQCTKCLHETPVQDVEMEFKQHIFLHVTYQVCQGDTITICLSEIPSTLNFGGNAYTLRGCIGQVSPSADNMGHDVAYCGRDEDWRLFDNNGSSPTILLSDEKIKCEILLYTL